MRARIHFLSWSSLLVCLSALVTAGDGGLCTKCTQGYVAPSGHGAAADGRRIITIAIDSSWDSSPGTTNSLIWNAATCARDKWNDTTDPYGNKTGYFIVIDQSHSYGTPDITIKKEECSVGAGWGCTSIVTGEENNPSTMKLPEKNATGVAVRDEDRCGRVAHEIMHKFGGNSHQCYTQSTILYGTGGISGRRDHNDVQGVDVQTANLALMSAGDCSGTDATFSEPDNNLEPVTGGGDETYWEPAYTENEVQIWCDFHYTRSDHYVLTQYGWQYTYSTYEFQYMDNCQPLECCEDDD